ncbi:hypothetical protein T02_11132 [Trichinella nativa]|uniref:Uncharacterized protein n=1 Tax=Trichinella nativa TaxID=6335 RepID=A0A0V1KK45_9BILA|nr:hypothetical protein T02_11132 [Trichinella nativa]
MSTKSSEQSSESSQVQFSDLEKFFQISEKSSQYLQWNKKTKCDLHTTSKSITRMSLIRSQCVDCSTDYDTCTGIFVVCKMFDILTAVLRLIRMESFAVELLAV